MNHLLPPELSQAILTQDLLQSVAESNTFFGVEGSLTLFALEVHEVAAGALEQTAHADSRMDEEIRCLPVTGIISIKGSITTMVYCLISVLQARPVTNLDQDGLTSWHAVTASRGGIATPDCESSSLWICTKLREMQVLELPDRSDCRP